MKVSFYKVQNYNNYSQQNSFPSFKMKMNELKGIDQFVARRYKINPQPIKTLQAFQEKCKSFVDDIAKRASEGKFSGRQQETQVQRKAIIKDWYDYVTKENGAYTSAMALMILGGITAGLKSKEDTLPPVLNKGVLANTVEEIRTNIPENPDDNAVSFDKKYRLNLQKSMMGEEKALDENLNGWIKIPSKEHDPENFEANVDKLKMLSHGNWCTKSFNAEPYLADGDFHVYMEKGKPKLGVRFVGDEIQEIQGELNNSTIPVKYGDIAKDHIKDYKLRENAQEEIQNLEKAKEQIKEFKAKFKNGIENASTQEILENFGIKCKKDTDGLLIISHYGKGEREFTLSDLGIDETKLFKNIKIIERDAVFEDSQVKDLGNLQSIGGYADFSNLQVQSLGNLQSIGGNAYFSDSQVQSLGNLQSIGGYAIFRYSQVQSLGNLQSIGGCADFSNSQVQSLGNLQSIGGNADFMDSQVQSLGNLQSIGRYADFRNSQIQSLGNLQSIGGDAVFEGSQVKDFGNLQSIGGDADFEGSQVKDLGNLQSIGGWADFRDSQVQSLGNLQSIGENVHIANCPLSEKDFEKIQVGGEIE